MTDCVVVVAPDVDAETDEAAAENDRPDWYC